MAVDYSNALTLLGKEVSFLYIFTHKSEDYSFEYEGVVTDILFHLNASVEIRISGSDDFFILDDLDQFTIDS